ncbi:AMP-binding protein [Streptomyces sp. AC495_CC817]|uniref:AMP-binding protein n=1 Tax=Streptomyces sp. AC495_CC817 TaxID=2823900 RepID=UPI0020B6804C|nr:AMP-binding protein [Streptomyces sp. AC495_CC817]
MIFRSKYPDVAAVDRPVHEWVLGDASRRGTRPAMVDVSSGRTVTYGELAALVRGLAAGLAAEGVGKGDVVALHSPNTVLFPVVLYATTTVGGTVTTLSPLATPGEIAKQLIDAEARLMVSVSALVETARTAVELVRRQTGRDIEILVCDKADGYRSVLGLLNDGVVPAFSTDPAVDVAVLPYSSGTTGVPKGVMLTHRNLCTNLAGPLTKTIVTNPMAHKVTSFLDHRHGQPLRVYDANLKKTETTYDALGRLTALWEPNRNKAAGYSANTTFTYRIGSSEPSWVSTSKLKKDGETYNTGYELYDSMMRPLQTQTPTPLGGQVLTDTRYDTRGLAYEGDARGVGGERDRAAQRMPDKQGRSRHRPLQCLGEPSPVPRGPTPSRADVRAQTGLPGHVEHAGGPAGSEHPGQVAADSTIGVGPRHQHHRRRSRHRLRADQEHAGDPGLRLDLAASVRHIPAVEPFETPIPYTLSVRRAAVDGGHGGRVDPSSGPGTQLDPKGD